MHISMIAAVSQNMVIGVDNKLPWNLPIDMKHFVRMTKGKTVVMGRKTFHSIGKALPNRTNIILTRDKKYTAAGCLIAHTLDQAIELADILGNNDGSLDEPHLMVIGGEEIYRQFLPHAQTIYLTEVQARVEGTAYFPKLDNAWVPRTSSYFPADRDNTH